MIDAMVDLETMGTRPGSTILSIGATLFDGNGVGRKFYVVVSRESCKAYGLTEDPSTVEWWSKRSPEVREVLTECEERGIDLRAALLLFNTWLIDNSTSAYNEEKHKLTALRVWGCGSDFDNAFLSFAYGAVGLEEVWNFWNNRCYRTMKSLYPKVKMVRVGTYHNAGDDAHSQALHAVRLLRKMPRNEIKAPNVWQRLVQRVLAFLGK